MPRIADAVRDGLGLSGQQAPPIKPRGRYVKEWTLLFALEVFFALGALVLAISSALEGNIDGAIGWLVVIILVARSLTAERALSYAHTRILVLYGIIEDFIEEEGRRRDA